MRRAAVDDPAHRLRLRRRDEGEPHRVRTSLTIFGCTLFVPNLQAFSSEIRGAVRQQLTVHALDRG